MVVGGRTSFLQPVDFPLYCGAFPIEAPHPEGANAIRGVPWGAGLTGDLSYERGLSLT